MRWRDAPPDYAPPPDAAIYMSKAEWRDLQVNLAALEAHRKHQGRNWRRIKRECFKAMTLARRRLPR